MSSERQSRRHEQAGSALRQARWARQTGLLSVAHDLQIPYQAIQAMEAGRWNDVNLELLVRYAAYLGVDLGDRLLPGSANAETTVAVGPPPEDAAIEPSAEETSEDEPDAAADERDAAEAVEADVAADEGEGDATPDEPPPAPRVVELDLESLKIKRSLLNRAADKVRRRPQY